MHPEFVGWLEWLGFENVTLKPLAFISFSGRCYETDDQRVACDFSDTPESIGRIINLSLRLSQEKIAIPNILAFEQHKGFLLFKRGAKYYLIDSALKGDARGDYDKAVMLLAKLSRLSLRGLETLDTQTIIERLNGWVESYFHRFLDARPECMESRLLLGAFMHIASQLTAQQVCFAHGAYDAKCIGFNQEGKIELWGYDKAFAAPMFYDVATLLHESEWMIDTKEYKRLFTLYLESIKYKDDFSQAFEAMEMCAIFIHMQKIAKEIEHIAIASNPSESFIRSLKYVLRIARSYQKLIPIADMITRYGGRFADLPPQLRVF